MIIELLLLEELQFEKVSYYTVWVQGRPVSEFDDFITRMSIDPKDKRQLSEINRHIEDIGAHYGAQDEYFQREGNAERLPPPYYRFFDSDGESDFGLRLYCIRISDEIVILLNGGRKIAQAIKDCPNCKPHFDFANAISDEIYYARRREEIEIDGRDILTEEGFVLNIA